jgi:hypothetical protein
MAECDRLKDAVVEAALVWNASPPSEIGETDAAGCEFWDALDAFDRERKERERG